MGATVLKSGCWNNLSVTSTPIHFLLESIEWEGGFLLNCASWPKLLIWRLGRKIYPLEGDVSRYASSTREHAWSPREFVTALPGVSDVSKGWYSSNNLLVGHSALKFFNLLNKSISLSQFSYKHFVLLLGYRRVFLNLCTCCTVWLLHWKEAEPLDR